MHNNEHAYNTSMSCTSLPNRPFLEKQIPVEQVTNLL